MTDDDSATDGDESRAATDRDESQADADPDEPDSDVDEPGSDVKTAPDGTPIRRTTPPEQWEAVGRDVLATIIHHRRAELVHELEEVVGAIEYGEPVTDDHVHHLRLAIEMLERAVENHLVALVDDAEPWAHTARRIPDDKLRDAVDLDREEIERLRESREDGTSSDDEAGGSGET